MSDEDKGDKLSSELNEQTATISKENIQGISAL